MANLVTDSSKQFADPAIISLPLLSNADPVPEYDEVSVIQLDRQNKSNADR